MTDPLARARALADDLLFPAAEQVERAGAVPRSHLDALAEAGLYGLTGPADAGGLAASPGTLHAVLELLAGGDLSTAFIWLQHLGLVGMLAGTPGPLREEHLADLCAGRLRSGIALLAATRPGPAAILARLDGDDVLLDGAVPWVTGWGSIDVVLVAARTAQDDVLFLVVDAHEAPGLVAVPQEMVAVTASGTVELEFTGFRVPGDRLVQRVPLDRWLARDQAGLRTNGSLALGVTGRCVQLLPAALSAAAAGELTVVRRQLDDATPDQLPAARAAAAALAHRTAGLLVTATGSSSITAGHPAERLAREALFLLVFGSRPAIRKALLGRL